MRLEFERLPLLEVSARFSLGMPLPISLPFLLELAARIGEPFIEIDDIGALDAPPGQQSVVNLDPGLCHGIRLKDPGRNIAIHIQSHLLGVRWNSDSPVEDIPAATIPYPKFEALRETLSLVSSRIREMLGDEALVPTVANMVYTDFIVADHESGLNRLAELFSDFVPPHVTSGRRVHEIMNSWVSDRDIDVRVHAHLGEANDAAGGRVVGYVFKSSAGSKIGDSAAFEILDVVHEQACLTFEAMLTEQALREWVRK